MDCLRAVLLDLDGTLVDANDAIVEGVLLLAADVGLAVPSAAWVRAFIGRPPEAVWQALGADDPVAMTVRFAQEVGPGLPARTAILPGVEAALDAFLQQGLLLAVATTRKTHSARDTLAALGILERVPVVVGRDRAQAPKPAPDVLLAALSDLGCTADEALMIGDTEADALAAVAAGMPCWGVLGGVGDEATLRAAGAELILYDGLAGAPAVLAQRRARRETTR